MTIGKIIKPIGLQGELRIGLLTDFPERFEALESVSVRTKEGQNLRYRIARVRYGPPYVYLIFEGLSSREAVAPLQGGLLQIPEDERICLPEGEYFQSDLIGMDVFLERGVCLGVIESIIETSSNDIFVVKDSEREYLIPALHDIILQVDLAKKRMTVDPSKGLLAL